jgi:prephenate dehydrogenase
VDLANALEAQPFFIDVTEHDGLLAGADGLPNLLSIALLLATIDTPGWREMRKFAGSRFASATELASDVYEHYTAVFLNRENVLLRLNGLLSTLIHLRDLLADGDDDALEEVFAKAVDGRAAWISDRKHGVWDREGAVDVSQIPTSGDRVGRIFFGERLFNRLRQGSGHSRQE